MASSVLGLSQTPVSDLPQIHGGDLALADGDPSERILESQLGGQTKALLNEVELAQEDVTMGDLPLFQPQSAAERNVIGGDMLPNITDSSSSFRVLLYKFQTTQDYGMAANSARRILQGMGVP